MDRLSAYAAREAESESPEDRKQTEKEAISRLMENLRLSKESKPPEAKADATGSKETNGEQINGDKPAGTPSTETDGQPHEDPNSNTPIESDGGPPPTKSRGIPEDVKLYEIFYEQVINLVNAQRLQIQDTIALLVSLSNLAL